MRWSQLTLFTLLLTTACSGLGVAPTATPSPSPSASPSASPTASASPSASPTLTTTPSPTPMPTATHTPSVTPTPSLTPQATVGFVFDNWGRAEVPSEIRDGIENPLLVFTNSNDQVSITNLATASFENTEEILYFAPASNPQGRIPILSLNSATQKQIYLSPAGNALAYLSLEAGRAGLYILDLSNALTGRIAALNSLTQRGIFSRPVWTSDGRQLAVTLDTGYALDIFLYALDGSGRVNLTEHGAYDFYPAFSPDGRYMAFVSDRATCPSWNPADAPAFCDALTQVSPIGGQVYVMDLQSREVRQVSDVFTTEAPEWVNANQLAFAGGDFTDLLNPSRRLYLADVARGTVQAVVIPGDENLIYLSEAWKPDGSAVLVQRVRPAETELVLLQTDGFPLRQLGDSLGFPRFGMSAAWSPDGTRLAIGGVDGLCPYGVRVGDAELNWVQQGSPPPSMCNPVYSADGRFLAFTGVNPNVDGRVDIYSANQNGQDQRNMTVDLRGTMNLIGWIGGE